MFGLITCANMMHRDSQNKRRPPLKSIFSFPMKSKIEIELKIIGVYLRDLQQYYETSKIN